MKKDPNQGAKLVIDSLLKKGSLPLPKKDAKPRKKSSGRKAPRRGK